jgi:hypothetical protein
LAVLARAAGVAIGVTGGAAIGTISGISGAASGGVGAATGGRVEAVSVAYCWVAVGTAYFSSLSLVLIRPDINWPYLSLCLWISSIG